MLIDRTASHRVGMRASVLECSRQIADRLHTRAGQRVELQKSGEAALGRVPPVRTTLDVQAESFFQPGYVRVRRGVVPRGDRAAPYTPVPRE